MAAPGSHAPSSGAQSSAGQAYDAPAAGPRHVPAAGLAGARAPGDDTITTAAANCRHNTATSDRTEANSSKSMTTTAASPRNNNAASVAHHHSGAEAAARGAVSARHSKAAAPASVHALAGETATPSHRAGMATTATVSSSPLPRNEDAAVSAQLACASDNATTSGCFYLLSQHVILPVALRYVRCYFMLDSFQAATALNRKRCCYTRACAGIDKQFAGGRLCSGAMASQMSGRLTSRMGPEGLSPGATWPGC